MDILNITIYKDKPPLYEDIVYSDNTVLKIFFAYDYNFKSLLGKTLQIQYNNLYIDEFPIQSNGMLVERKLNSSYVTPTTTLKLMLKDNNRCIQIPYLIKIKVEPKNCEDIDFIDKIIEEKINKNYIINNIATETHEVISKFMNEFNNKFSEDFIIKDKIYINKQEKYEYKDIYINYIEKINIKEPITTETDIYEHLIDDLYIHYNIKTERINIEKDLHDFAIDYYKNKAYLILEEEKRKALIECLSAYFFGIGNICDRNKLLNWYKQQENKITSYNDLSKEIIINKF